MCRGPKCKFHCVWTVLSSKTSVSACLDYFMVKIGNGKLTYKPQRLQRHQRAQAHNSTLNSQQSFIQWPCSKQNGLSLLMNDDLVPIL